MAERFCEGCRFYHDSTVMVGGFCSRNPPVGDGSELPEVGVKDWCGEWRDRNITPEQEDRRELVRRFAVALMATEWATEHGEDDIWEYATNLARYEPSDSKLFGNPE